MAPAFSGGTARQFRYNFQDDDLLGRSQPFSGTLQTVTIVGLEGKAESGGGMQKWGRDSFAVVGAGGMLKTCSDVRAATCAAVCAQLRDEGRLGALKSGSRQRGMLGAAHGPFRCYGPLSMRLRPLRVRTWPQRAWGEP